MFNFGKRQIRGMNYTRQISLPKEWLRFHEIDTGNEIVLKLTEEGNLLLVPVKGGESSDNTKKEAKAYAERITPQPGGVVLPLPRGRGGKKRR